MQIQSLCLIMMVILAW